MRSVTRGIAAAALIAALAGCAPKARVAQKPLPTAPAPDRQEPRERAPLQALNSDLANTEAAWHLRSALNVAALSCDQGGKLGLAASYNQLISRQRAPLATAYRAESARHARTLDAHVTRVYNLFAQPPSQTRFCAEAVKVAAEARAVAPDRFLAYAPGALERLVDPPSIAASPAIRRALATSSDKPWRIQLGAYSGDRAARTAWDRIRGRMTSAASFSPHYESVPDSALVRVRIGPVNDKSQAIALCAAAAGAGLDCLPVPPKA